MARNIIVLTRGDTFDFDVTIYDELYGDYFDGALPGDIVEFRLMHPNQTYSEAILKKSIVIGEGNPSGKCTFIIEHSETKDLPVGVYYYSVKVIRPGIKEQGIEPQVMTIINKTKFILND
jgi:hypothetical protein